MTLTYIYHSGLMLEGVSVILIFDFWRDADNSIVERTLSTTHKRVYFLASHFHQDHFNPEILNLPVPHGEKKVILSRDIYRRRRAGTEGVTAYLRRGESYRDDLITVHAFGSTDSGVSWAVHVEDKDIFHAGDLNNWHWADESTPQEIKKREGDFLAILNDIRKECTAFDLVMFPVDPRLGSDFARGARQWLQYIPTRYFAPMHFPPARERAMTFGAEAERMQTRFLYIQEEGEAIARF